MMDKFYVYRPMLDLIGFTEGTDKGDGYNESLAYGKMLDGVKTKGKGKDVALVKMTLTLLILTLTLTMLILPLLPQHLKMFWFGLEVIW